MSTTDTTARNNVTPRTGRIVLYTLNEEDVRTIIGRRISAGKATFSGNDPKAGYVYPAMIVQDWMRNADEIEAQMRDARNGTDWAGQSYKGLTDEQFEERVAQTRAFVSENEHQAVVNLQVFLDGTDTYWATSRSEFSPEKHRKQVADGFDAKDAGPDPRGHWVETSDDL